MPNGETKYYRFLAMSNLNEFFTIRGIHSGATAKDHNNLSSNLLSYLLNTMMLNDTSNTMKKIVRAIYPLFFAFKLTLQENKRTHYVTLHASDVLVHK